MDSTYTTYIYERYKSLKDSNKQDYDNYDLSKIFEYYTALKLKEKYNKNFYEYNDIPLEYKEINKMTKNDSGIDLCDLENSIVQCKLRKNNLTWTECVSFFSSALIKKNNILEVNYQNLIIARNEESKLSNNLLQKQELFIDITFKKEELLKFCENLLINYKPIKPIKEIFILRDYQVEAIEKIKNNKNIIISIPTGCGKNSIIIYSLDGNKKYLILVPRIILMEQLYDEIIKHKPEFKNNIQCLGNGDINYNDEILITICVFNSVHKVKDIIFDKIFIDEAHHINKPEIYKNEEDEILKDDEIVEDENLKDEINEDDNDESDENIEIIEEYEQEDINDELKNIKNYTDIIRNFKNQENNVYLSATIDKTPNFEYYNKDIREMINLKYLSDYTINIPIFSNDPTDKNVCNYLIKNYRNVIIYCNTQKEGVKINKIMNELQFGISYYVDCNTPKKERKKILNNYKKGEIAFLVNVKILVEGFDAPITKGVCFLHLPSNKTTLIQIIGRSLRLHKDKNISNVIIPFNNNDDEKTINKFLNIMASYDSRIKKSYDTKKLGGYVEIIKIDEATETNDIEFKYTSIFNNLGTCINNADVWNKNLEMVIEFIDKYKKLPNTNHKKIGIWLKHQKMNFKYEKYIMLKNPEIKQKFSNFINDEKYKHYFFSNLEKWFSNYDKLKIYIAENKKLPTIKKNKILKEWLSSQIKNFRLKRKSMKNIEIYNLWISFKNDEKYNKYFKNHIEIWYENFNILKNFYEKNNKLPDSLNNTKLNKWFSTQQYNYTKKINLMKCDKIFEEWTNFINQITPENKSEKRHSEWYDKFDELILFYEKNNDFPDVLSNKILNRWVQYQNENYTKKINIMTNLEIYNAWKNFLEKNNCKYTILNDKIWIENLKKVKKNLTDNVECEVKLKKWITMQKYSYKKNIRIMKNPEIRVIWENFIDEYKDF